MMQITSLIPDEYTGPVKRFICGYCQHISYVTLSDYQDMGNVLICHECSIQLVKRDEKKQQPKSYHRTGASISPVQHKRAYRDVFHAEYPHECSDHCRDYAILLLSNKLTPVLVHEKVYNGEKYPSITRFHILQDYRGHTLEDAIAFVNQQIASRPKGLTALEYRRICEALCSIALSLQERETHVEAVAKERLYARNEVVTEEILAREVKQVEIEETPLAMAFITMMHERTFWQGTTNQLQKALRPYLQESPTFLTHTLEYVATLLPLHGINITLNEKKPEITISKLEIRRE